MESLLHSDENLPNTVHSITPQHLPPIDFNLPFKIVVYTHKHRVLYTLLDSIDSLSTDTRTHVKHIMTTRVRSVHVERRKRTTKSDCFSPY